MPYGGGVGRDRVLTPNARFEAFDEPWKVIYNTPTDGWESKWGLMDVNRNLKEGLTIPDCGGKTIDLTYGVS